MIRNRYLIILLLLFGNLGLNAQETKYINYFSASGDVCLPVTVKHSRGQFTFSSNHHRVDGPIDYVEAWDCRGRKILDTTPDRGGGYSTDKSKPIVFEYIFKTLYPDDSSSQDNYSNNDYNYNNNYQDYDDSNNESVPPKRNGVSADDPYGFKRFGEIIVDGTHHDDPAYDNITFQIGSSNVHGEYIRAKACLGGMTGYILYGGVGMNQFFKAKNPDFMEPDPKKKMAWHAGLGMYGGSEEGEFAFLMDYAETPLIKNGSINMWLEGTWYFGANGHIGIYGGIGASGGNLKKKKPEWNFIFEMGLAFRFF